MPFGVFEKGRIPVNVKPLMLATMIGMGAVSIAALSGCAAQPADDVDAKAAVAARASADAPPVPPVETKTEDIVDPAALAAATAPPPPPPVESVPEVVVPDATLVPQVKAALAKHNAGLKHVSVSSHDGVVRLSGFVPSSVQIDQAQYVTSEIPGVREVDNRLKVK